MPHVSVIIPTYQRAHWVGEAIQSVLAQRYTDYEILVVNDGGTDHTREVLEQFGRQIVVMHQHHQGVSAARNAGIHAARGQYIAFLDDDDLWHPDKLEKQLALLENDPDVGLVYADMLVFDERGTMPGTYFERLPPPGQASGWHFLYNWIPTSTVVMRRACFDAVGLFDETLMACEDYDLWLRFREGHWQVHQMPEPLARYRLSATNMHKDQERMLLSVIRVKEQAFHRNPALRHLDPRLLDRHFYHYYLDLARLYLAGAEGAKARSVLQRYRHVRGTSTV
jgi:glycosyltransferase involved in cell wall biosynthesis